MINLPEKFERDIQGNSTSLIPLVVINNSIYISTSKVTLDSKHYSPIISSMNDIKESIDIEDKKFKISNITITLFNYSYNNAYISEVLFKNELMNTQLDIYWKSQSAETLSDCLPVYSGYIRNVEENRDTVRLEIEDKTEQSLHKDLPRRSISVDVDVPDKYKNKPIPIVYGEVDKAPCVFIDDLSNLYSFGEDSYTIIPDDNYIQSIESPKLFLEQVYMDIPQNAEFFMDVKAGTVYSGATEQQWTIDENNNALKMEKVIIADTPPSSDGSDPVFESGVVGSPIAFNYIEVIHDSKCTFSKSHYNAVWNQEGVSEGSAVLDVGLFQNIESTLPAHSLDEKPYLSVADFKNMPIRAWLWGNHNGQLGNDDGVIQTLIGESALNFELESFCKSSDIVKELAVGVDSDPEPIKSPLYIYGKMKAEVQQNKNNTFGVNALPRLFFQWGEDSVNIWELGDTLPQGDDIIQGAFWVPIQFGSEQGGIHEFQRTLYARDPEVNKFVIGQRHRSEQGLPHQQWTSALQNGQIFNLKINELGVRRNVLINQFLNRDVYIHAYGRVDNQTGKYTSSPEIRSTQREDIYSGTGDFRSLDLAPVRVEPTTKPVGKPARKPARKPIRKPKINVKSKKKIRRKGGY